MPAGARTPVRPPEIPAGKVPAAWCDLVPPAQPYDTWPRRWRVLACPYCGGEHLHAAGWRGDNPWRYLGRQPAPCASGRRYLLRSRVLYALPKAVRDLWVEARHLTDVDHIKLLARARRAGMDRPRPGKRPWPWDAPAAPQRAVLARVPKAVAAKPSGTPRVAPATPRSAAPGTEPVQQRPALDPDLPPRPRPRPVAAEVEWQPPMDRASPWRRLRPKPAE